MMRSSLLLFAGLVLVLMAAGDADAKEPLWNYTTGNEVMSVAISDDGEYIAAGSEDEIYLFKNGGETPLWSYSTTGDVHLTISADGEYIAAVASNEGSASNESRVYLFDKDNSTPL